MGVNTRSAPVHASLTSRDTRMASAGAISQIRAAICTAEPKRSLLSATGSILAGQLSAIGGGHIIGVAWVCSGLSAGGKGIRTLGPARGNEPVSGCATGRGEIRAYELRQRRCRSELGLLWPPAIRGARSRLGLCGLPRCSARSCATFRPYNYRFPSPAFADCPDAGPRSTRSVAMMRVSAERQPR